MINRAAVIEDLKAIVKTDRTKWSETAFERAVDAALSAFSDARPLTATASLLLIAGQRHYPAPADMRRYIGTDWTFAGNIRPWDDGFPGVTPRIYDVVTASGRVIEFFPAPTSKHLTAYGHEFEYYYSAKHVMTNTDSSIRDEDYDLFVTRCLISLMRDLMVAHVTDPVQMHRGMGSSTPTSATASVIFNTLMDEWKRGISC